MFKAHLDDLQHLLAVFDVNGTSDLISCLENNLKTLVKASKNLLDR